MCASSFAGSLFGYITTPIVRVEKPAENKIPYSAKQLSTQSITVGYVCKEKDNNIAIYTKMKNGSLRLYEKYDVLVSMLPKYDREALEDGMEFDNLSDALVLIENYSA